VESSRYRHNKRWFRLATAKRLCSRHSGESAVAKPEASFGGEDLFPSLAEKAGALGHALIQIIPLWMVISVWVMSDESVPVAQWF